MPQPYYASRLMRGLFCCALFCAMTIPFPSISHAQEAAPTAPSISPTDPIDLSTPEKTLSSFTAAMLRGDWDGAVKCVVGAAPSALTHQFKKEPRFPIADFKITKTKVTPSHEANTVTMTYIPIIVMISGTDGITGPTETMTFHKGTTGWQIVPLERAKFRPEQNSMVIELSFMLANPDVALAARRAGRDGRAEADEALHSLEELPGLSVGSEARLYRDKNRSAIPVAVERADLDSYVVYGEVKQLREEHPEPFVKASKGFTDKDVAAALTKAKADADRVRASGKILFLPHGTRVRITEHIKGDAAASAFLSSANELQRALKPENHSIFGVWRAEVLDGASKGQTVWAYDVQGPRWAMGDFVTIALPKKPGAPVPAATSWEAGKALSPVGQDKSDPKFSARFDRLIKEKRFVLLPAGSRYMVEDFATDGSVALLKPLAGPYKGTILFVRAEHVTLAKD